MRKSRAIPKHKTDGCSCELCRNNHSFEMPQDLYERFKDSAVVVFAGAGVSTETRAVYPYTLYQDVCADLNIGPESTLPFPDLMSRFCSQSDGRPKLLRKIRDRFDYVRSFPELYRAATRFHHELSTLSVVSEIVTTNWNPYFELECGATPFVTAEDFAFWTVPGRKVFKIHGSVDSYGSIVATREDYNACHQRLTEGLLGSTLRMLLATKTIVYLGFSFSDDDFIQLHGALVAEMKGLCPQSYIVTLDSASDGRFRANGLIPIYTDATYFISKIKQRFVSEHQRLDDERFVGVGKLLMRVRKAHHEVADIDARQFPDVIFGLSYQDGLVHALERILALKNTGYYSHACNPRNMARLYLGKIRADKMKKRRYHDVAYVEGYADGLVYFIADDELREMLPIYFTFGEKKVIYTLSDYKRALVRAARTSSREHKFAKQLVKRRDVGDGIVPHHTPFLL